MSKVLSRYTDARIRLMHVPKPLLQPNALNWALPHVRGSYIAKMDSDDLSHPKRLAKQVRYLRRHREVGILGTDEAVINRGGTVYARNHFPTSPAYIQWSILLGGWCISHPSVMMRTAVLKQLGGYASGLRVTEDYELWSRAIFKTQITNLPEPLLKRRVWGGNISLRHAQTERKIVLAAMHKAMEKLLDKTVSRRIVENLFWLERKMLLANFKPKTKIDRQLMQHCRRLEKGLALTHVQDAMLAAETLRALYRRFFKTGRLTQEEKKLITLHLMERFSVLVSEAKRLGMAEQTAARLFSL